MATIDEFAIATIDEFAMATIAAKFAMAMVSMLKKWQRLFSTTMMMKWQRLFSMMMFLMAIFLLFADIENMVNILRKRKKKIIK
jgi:hypothetical protein